MLKELFLKRLLEILKENLGLIIIVIICSIIGGSWLGKGSGRKV